MPSHAIHENIVPMMTAHSSRPRRLSLLARSYNVDLRWHRQSTKSGDSCCTHKVPSMNASNTRTSLQTSTPFYPRTTSNSVLAHPCAERYRTAKRCNARSMPERSPLHNEDKKMPTIERLDSSHRHQTATSPATMNYHRTRSRLAAANLWAKEGPDHHD